MAQNVPQGNWHSFRGWRKSCLGQGDDRDMTDPAYEILGAGRAGRWLVTCDHATNRVPAWVGDGTLGIDAQDMARHIAYDVGAAGLTRALALEYAKSGITINAVCPGYTETEIVKNSIDRVVAKTGRTSAQALAEFVKSNPQGRLVQPQEVADTVLWLCGKGASAITGQSIAVAGGEVM